MRGPIAAFAALAGLANSQRVQVDVTLDGDSNNLEYSKTQSFKCSWEMSEKLVAAGLGVDEPLQIRWYYKGNMIYTMEADEYTPYPSFQTEFYTRTDIEASVNRTEKFSTLKIGNVQLSDAGDYKCRVSLAEPRELEGRKGFASGNANKANVKVYATPNVTFEDLNISHDLRASQYASWVEQQVTEAPIVQAANDTADAAAQPAVEEDTAVVDEQAVEEDIVSVEEEATAVTEASRKRRQVETAVAPDVESVTAVQLNLGTCKISGAYPEPAAVSVFVGSDVLEKNPDLSSNEREDKLFDTEIKVGATLKGSMNNQALKCVASDADNMYSVEGVSQEVLDIKYLPETVELLMPEVVYDQDVDVTVSCKSDGNPAPVLALMSSEESIQQAIGNGSSYTIPKINKDQAYQFWCLASTSNQNDYQDYKIESAPETMDVNFLGVPTIDVDGERSTISENNFSIAKDSKFSITCEAVAKPEATYQWFKDGETLGESNTYQVDKATWKDSGKFYCTATNGGKIETKSKEVQISVQGECEISGVDIVKQKKDSKTGEQDVELTCLLVEEVQPTCTVQWINTDKDLFKTKSKGATLVVKAANMMDEDALINARLTCKASNDFSSFSPTYIVKGKDIAQEVTMEDTGVSMWLIIGAIAVIIIGFVIFLKKRNSGNPEHEATEGKTTDSHA